VVGAGYITSKITTLMYNNNINNAKSNITHHIFTIDEAIKYGIEKAIILYNLRYWLEHNRANGKNIHEYDGDDERYHGRTFVWTYNSSTAFEKLFPYMKASSIRRWLSELEQDGVLVSSNAYNQHRYDKTKWYSIVSEFELVNEQPIDQNERGIAQNEQRVDQNEQTIPNVNTNVNTNVNNNAQSEIERMFNSFWDVYPRKVAKKKAKQIFTSLLKKKTGKARETLFAEIMSGLRKYKNSRQWSDAQYIPHPTTWLNQERWRDEVEIIKKREIIKI